MHRLASKACQDHKGLTGISITGKPIAFIRKAFLFRFVDLISIFCGKLATVAQISFIANGGHLRENFNVLFSFPYIVPGLVSEPIITYPGESILINEVTSAYSLLNPYKDCRAVILLKVKHEN
jgi:hypothetical protein